MKRATAVMQTFKFSVGALIIFTATACTRSSAPPENVVAASAAPAVVQGQSALPVAENDIAPTVERVLTSADHPGLKWNDISDVAAVLKPLYASEPDALAWFDATAPLPIVDATLAAIAAAGEYGLDPADYDTTFLEERWADVKAKTATGPERAHFDLAISVAAARMLRAVHVGRVDPATMNWGYDVTEKKIDVSAALRDARQGKGLRATLDALEPPVSHYRRARKTLPRTGCWRAPASPRPSPICPRVRRRSSRGNRGPACRNWRRDCALSAIYRRIAGRRLRLYRSSGRCGEVVSGTARPRRRTA